VVHSRPGDAGTHVLVLLRSHPNEEPNALLSKGSAGHEGKVPDIPVLMGRLCDG